LNSSTSLRSAGSIDFDCCGFEGGFFITSSYIEDLSDDIELDRRLFCRLDFLLLFFDFLDLLFDFLDFLLPLSLAKRKEQTIIAIVITRRNSGFPL
jgi:hypothetical protein